MKYYFRCPNCGSDEKFVKRNEQDPILGCALLLTGGFIPALLYGGHTRNRIQCAHCLQVFAQPPIPSSSLAKFAVWIIALTVIPVFVSGFFFCIADLANLLPPFPVINSIEEAITAQPRVAAYLLVLLVALIVFPCWLIACLSNAKLRKQLATQYELKPVEPSDVVHPTPAAPESNER